MFQSTGGDRLRSRSALFRPQFFAFSFFFFLQLVEPSVPLAPASRHCKKKLSTISNRGVFLHFVSFYLLYFDSNEEVRWVFFTIYILFRFVLFSKTVWVIEMEFVWIIRCFAADLNAKRQLFMRSARRSKNSDPSCP